MGTVIDLVKRRIEDANIRRHAARHVKIRLAACKDMGLDPTEFLGEFRKLQEVQLDLMQELHSGQRPFDTLARETIAEIDRQLARLR